VNCELVRTWKCSCISVNCLWTDRENPRTISVGTVGNPVRKCNQTTPPHKDEVPLPLPLPLPLPVCSLPDMHTNVAGLGLIQWWAHETFTSVGLGSFWNVGEFLEHLASEEGREVCWSLNLTKSEQLRNEGREVYLEQLAENIIRY
jgi:hypothetical protein